MVFSESLLNLHDDEHQKLTLDIQKTLERFWIKKKRWKFEQEHQRHEQQEHQHHDQAEEEVQEDSQEICRFLMICSEVRICSTIRRNAML